MNRAKYKYEDFADRNLNVVGRSGSEYMVRCVFHDNEGSPSMQFNVERGLFICFSCGAGGGIKKLSKHLGIKFSDPGVDVNDLLAKLNTLKSQNDQDMQLTVLSEDTLNRYDFPTDYWGSCDEGTHRKGCTGRPGCKYHRWFTPQTIEAFDLGYDPLQNAAIIPVRNINGGLIGVIRRFLDPDVEFRYKYPKGFKRSTALFGSWLVEHDDSDMAVIGEGSLDGAAIWQAGFMGLAQYGSSLSPSQIRIMLRLGIREVVLFQDNDKAGRKAMEQALGWKQHLRNGKLVTEYDQRCDLTRHFIVSRINYKGVDQKDPGSMTPEEIRLLIDSREDVLLKSP